MPHIPATDMPQEFEGREYNCVSEFEYERILEILEPVDEYQPNPEEYGREPVEVIEISDDEEEEETPRQYEEPTRVIPHRNKRQRTNSWDNFTLVDESSEEEEEEEEMEREMTFEEYQEALTRQLEFDMRNSSSRKRKINIP